ncbi:hypothetical protein IQ259_11710 [Fortiea sp. LEGE XX443]|uniref:hypothetical protein n=1 Tax=Fortiea sp. LEGE XX443 TaxID=1828611 RepID=UPI001880D3E8|nr:hypothetical protein [Fortiea sp. LEGE XX443]MBE9005693.1 hypothetical protein [Fortiea sp. LEGE XX443]
MDAQLTSNEINVARELLGNYAPAKHALDVLEKHNGNCDTSFDELWIETNGVVVMPEGKSLWQTTLKVLRQELCGDEGFRGQLKEYTKNPGSTPLLTGLIVSLVGVAAAHGLPLDPAIATVVVLYILKIGLNIFCDYTEPPAGNSGTLPPAN